MLTRRELACSPEELAEVLRERTSGLELDTEAPQAARDIAYLFELDNQVRNGGFAQYFFNRSCVNAFDAWFATLEIDDPVHELLSLALIRVGAEFEIALDLGDLVERRQDLGPPYARLLDVHTATHQTDASLIEQFTAFRERLAGARGELVGLDALDLRFYAESDVPAALAAYVAASPDAFVQPDE